MFLCVRTMSAVPEDECAAEGTAERALAVLHVRERVVETAMNGAYGGINPIPLRPVRL